jgi:DNA polymerase-1
MLVDQEQLWALGNQYVGDFDKYLQDGVVSGGEIGTLLAEFHDLARKAGKYPDPNHQVNPNSPPQVVELLFDRMKMPTKWGRGSDKKILDKLPAHPVVKALRNIRRAYKAFGTYVMGVYNAIEDDGRVHTTYKIHGTRTGRLSSAEPNVQNVPRLAAIRSVYVAGPGRRFLEVDLNQAELRSLAVLSKDPFMCKIYTTKGMSLHDEVRASIWGDPKDWTWEQRQKWIQQFGIPANSDDKIIMGEQKMRAKAVNFGIVYGRTAQSLAEEFDIPIREAQGWIDAWFKRFPEAKKFIDRCRNAVLTASTLITPFGRKKRHWIVTQDMLNAMQNEAANFPHQGIASDTNNDGAMTVTGVHEYMNTPGRQKLEKYLKDYDAFIVNLVHDSQLIDIPDDDEVEAAVRQLVTSTLEAIPPKWGFRRIPFKADAKSGKAWGRLESSTVMPANSNKQSEEKVA